MGRSQEYRALISLLLLCKKFHSPQYVTNVVICFTSFSLFDKNDMIHRQKKGDLLFIYNTTSLYFINDPGQLLHISLNTISRAECIICFGVLIAKQLGEMKSGMKNQILRGQKKKIWH